MAAYMESAKGQNSPKKERIARKRKRSENKSTLQDENELVKKISKKEEYSVAKFKLQMKDPNTNFIALENFVKCARGYPSTTQVDIVEGYCQTSPDCKEIFSVLDAGRRKPSEIQLVMEALECILLRLADDLTHCKPVSQIIIRRLLSTHMSPLYYVLSGKNKSAHIKSVLRMLTAMVMQGTDAARDILTQFHFQHPNVLPLFDRRDKNDPQDVRSCFIQFLISFLVVGDKGITQQLMESKGLLNGMFNNMNVDKVSTLQLVLPTLKEKVVDNIGVSKTLKVRVFNERTLTELVKLYQWKGPAKWQKDQKIRRRSHQHEPEIIVPNEEHDTNEEKVLVRHLVHDFLMSLCCSLKTGINFHDKTMGTSKNMNHLLTSMLNAMTTPYNDDLMSKLVVEVLKICPDQLVWYLPTLRSSLQPRPTPAWHKAITLLHQILFNQPLVSVALKQKEVSNKLVLAKMVMNTLLPPKDVWAQIIATLQSGSRTVKHEGMKILLVVLQRVKATLDFCQQPHPVYTAQELADLQVSLINTISKALPDTGRLINCWNSVINPSKQVTDAPQTEAMKEDQDDIVKGVSEVAESTFLLAVLQVLCAYQVSLPEIFLEHSLDFSALLEGVRAKVLEQQESKEYGSNAAENDEDAVSMLQLHLLQLLAQSDIRQLSWMKESFSHRSTLYLLLEMTVSVAKDAQLRDSAVSLLAKLLQGTGAFEGVDTELKTWLYQLTEVKMSDAHDVIHFLEKVIASILRDPHTYAEMAIDVTAEVGQSGTQDSASVTTNSDALFDMIVSMDDVDLSDMKDGQVSDASAGDFDRLPFSVLIPASLKTVKDTNPPPAVNVYFQTVVRSVLCQQEEPAALCLLLTQYKDVMALNPLKSLANVWLPDKLKMNVKEEKKLKKSKNLFDLVEQSIVHEELLSKLEDVKLENLNLSDTGPLMRRVLLSFRTMLNGDATKENLEVLVNVMQSVQTWLLEQPVVNKEGKEEPKQRLAFLDTGRYDVAEALTDFYKLFLCHPSVREWFLFFGKMKNKSKRKHTQLKTKCTSILVANILSHITKDIENILATELDFYREKLTESVEKGDVDSDMVVTCLTHMVNVLHPNQQLCIAEHLLGMPTEAIVTDATLTELGKGLLLVLQRILATPKSLVNNLAISYASMKHLIKLATSMSTFDEIIEKFLTTSPELSCIINQETICHCLVVGRDTQLSLLATCLKLSPTCRYWFCTYMSQTKLKLKMCQRISAVILHYLDYASKEGQGGCRGTVDSLQQLLLACLVPAREAVDWTLTEYHVQHLEACHQKLAKKIAAVVMKDIDKWVNSGEKCNQEVVVKLITWTQADSAAVHERFVEMALGSSSCSLAMVETWYLVTSHGVSSADRWNQVLLAVLSCLLNHVTDGETRADSTEQALLDMACNILQRKDFKLEKASTELRNMWPHLTKQCLRSLYTYAAVHEMLRGLVGVMYHETSITPDAKTLHNMLLSHSSFLAVMLDDNPQLAACKEKLVELLLALVKLDKSCCDKSHIAVLLGAYSASLSKTDEIILALMFEYEVNNCDMKSYRPYLWGAKAVEHHSLKKRLGASLWKQPSMEQVLEALDMDTLHRSILHFPLTRSATEKIASEANRANWRADVYDPLFMLPLFADLLSPGYLVHCSKFVEDNCLGYTLVALSSHDKLVRGAAYHVLHLFYQQLESSRTTNKDQLVYFIKFIRNSIETPAAKLSPIVTVFLAKTAAIIIDPEHKLYKAINAFLLLKPKLDTLNVPEFYKLFNSVEAQYKTERTWMLSLLRDGLRETGDYRIYERRYIFKLLLTFHDSPLSDVPSKKMVLDILCRACKLKTVAFDLVKNHTLLTWITALIQNNPCSWSAVIELLNTLWFSILGGRDEAAGQDRKRPCLPLQFTMEMCQVMLHLLTSIRVCMTEADLNSYLTCLTSIVHHVHKTMQIASDKQDNTETSAKLIKTSLSLLHLLLLLQHWSSTTRNQATETQVAHIYKAITGKDMTSLTDADKGLEKSNDQENASQNHENNLKCLTDIILTWKVQSTDRERDTEALLFLASWCLSVLLDFQRDSTRWQQYVVWLIDLLRSYDSITITMLKNYEISKRLLQFYNPNDCILMPHLNETFTILFQASLKHKEPESLYQSLSTHFKSAMNHLSKEMNVTNMQELLTELVMEAFCQVSEPGHFQFLLSKS